MSIPWYENAVAHLGAGIAISFTDRFFSTNTKKYAQERVKDKLDQVASLQYIVEHQNSNPSELMTSKEYLNAVMKSKEYFAGKGIHCKTGKGLSGFFEGVSNTFNTYRKLEKVNNLSWDKKLYFSLGVELAGDAIMEISQLAWGKGNGVAALGKSVYQAPAMFLGLQIGRGLLGLGDLMFKSKDEKELDAMAKALTSDGKLLEIVNNYSPTADIKPAKKTDAPKTETKEKVNLEEGAEKVGTVIADSAGKVSEMIGTGIDAIKAKISQRLKEKAAKENERRANLRKPYEKY